MKPAAAARADATESWILPVAQVNAWHRAAKPGERLIYAKGPQLLHGETTLRLRQLAECDAVHLFHRRSQDQAGFDYIAQRREDRVIKQQAPDPQMMAVLLTFKSVAIAGGRCPTDAELAEAMGLAVSQVQWLIAKLKKARLITTRLVPSLDTPRFRIVTIVSTGQETAGPK